MPAQPAWFHRLDEILTALRSIESTRLAVERLFGVRERCRLVDDLDLASRSRSRTRGGGSHRVLAVVVGPDMWLPAAVVQSSQWPARSPSWRFQDRHRQVWTCPVPPSTAHEHPRAQAEPLACISTRILSVPSIGASLAGVILTSNRGLRKDMREDMKQGESRLRDDMKQGESRLREDIGKLESRLDERIDRLEARLRDDIKQLGDRVGRLEA